MNDGLQIASCSLVVNELDIGNASVPIQANSNGNQEIVFRGRAEDRGNFLVDEDVRLLADRVLTVHLHLAHASNLSIFF